MSSPSHFISCDWGTTNFRLRVVEADSLEVLFELKTNQGIRKVYEKFLAQNKYDQKQFFSNYLKSQILKLPEEHHSWPIILAGMASSNIGLQELEYSDFPFDQNGESLRWEQMILHNGLEIRLISGVKCETGMMRGEETQAIGLGAELEVFGQGTLILPGTHSKHLRYENGAFTALTNFMTGELFEVLSQKSILASSVQGGELNEEAKAAFKEGLALGFSNRLSSSLLLVRANHVIRHTSKHANYYFLNGILIGDELSYLKNEKDRIFLAASDPVFSMYKMALQTYYDPAQLVFFDDKALEKALLKGQKKILTSHER